MIRTPYWYTAEGDVLHKHWTHGPSKVESHAFSFLSIFRFWKCRHCYEHKLNHPTTGWVTSRRHATLLKPLDI